MKQLVCESLQSFYKLNENVETSKKIFQEAGFDENSQRWKDFINTFAQDEKFMDLFAKLASSDKTTNSQFNYLLTDYEDRLKDKIDPSKIDQTKFTSFTSYLTAVNDAIKKQEKEIKNKEEKIVKEPKEDKNVRQEITQEAPKENKNIRKDISQKEVPEETPVKQESDTISPEQLKKEKQENEKKANEFYKKLKKQVPAPLLGYRLWLYAVYHMSPMGDVPCVKFGETYNEKQEGAEKYAMRHTLGKTSGMAKKENLLFCEDVTEFARNLSKRYVLQKHQQFDNWARQFMPGERGDKTNPWGVTSKEEHIHKPDETYEQIKQQWLDYFNKLVKEQRFKKPEKIYDVRPFHADMTKKISENIANPDKPDYDKFLLAAATGSGKEVATLDQIIHIHDNLKKKLDPETGNPVINEDTIHVSCATIPETELELIEELSRVIGMKSNSKMTEFSRIKGYCLNKFKKGYYGKLTPQAQLWFDRYIDPVESISDIETNKYFNSNVKDVPVLFGSFVHLGINSITEKPEKTYEALKKRIGILSIGEAHKFLSNISNKMWPAIKRNLNYKFLLLITGTPYDYIFNETADLYFKPDERVLFTRNDLYDGKRKYLESLKKSREQNDPTLIQGDPAFANYPDLHYYRLNMAEIAPVIKEEMQERGEWEGDENSFTFDKFFSVVRGKNKKPIRPIKFVYENAISDFFKRLLSSEFKPATAEYDPLSIYGAPDLCDYAKKHIIIALPTGRKGVSANEYIRALADFLKTKGALGDYTPLVVYKDDLKDIKETIKDDKTPTVTFTCNAMLTGTNIPAWGSLIFLRSIGNSIKFFEQATGRVGRAFKKGSGDEEEVKENAGIFLANIDNIMHLHVSVDEKIALEKDPSTKYSEIVERTFKNYYFYRSNGVQWNRITNLTDFREALRRASQEVDYRFELCINKPKVPDNFNLEVDWKNTSGKETSELTDATGITGKTGGREGTVKQGQFDFGDSKKDKEKNYRNMIKNHISRILIMCLLKGFDTIKEFSDFIKDAINKNDEYVLELMGAGVEYIPKYIDDPDQIDINYLNRWLADIKEDTSDEPTTDGMLARHHDINGELDLSKLSTSIIFDPLSFTEEVCSKIDAPLKSAKKILILEKNGSFTYSILKRIGIENASKLNLIILDKISNEIISYITGSKVKLGSIEYIENIKNIDNILSNMKNFDVIIGNPPYIQGFHLKFLNAAIDLSGEHTIFVEPATWLINEKPTKRDKIEIILKNKINQYGAKIYLYNGLNIFKVGLASYVSVIHINKLNSDKRIIVENKLNNESFIYDDINNISKYGNSKIYTSLKQKILSHPDNLLNHNKKVVGNYYVNLAEIRGHISDSPNRMFEDDFYTFIPKGKGVDNQPTHAIYFSFKSKNEAENFIKYLKTNFARFSLSIYKMNTNSNRGELKAVPWLDFSQEWTDEKLFKHFKLTPEQSNFINNNIPKYY